MTPENKETKQNLLNYLIDRAYGRFKATPSVLGPKGEEAYFPHHAVTSVVAETGIDAFELIGLLVEQTALTPEQIDFDGFDLKSAILFHGWQGLKNICTGIAEHIIITQMEIRYPDLTDECNRREKLFPSGLNVN